MQSGVQTLRPLLRAARFHGMLMVKLGSKMINYASVVGMLLYLMGHSCLDDPFTTNQCALYTFAPTRKHKCALIQIGCYLKGVLDKGLILSPSDTLHIDCYPDLNFAGL